MKSKVFFTAVEDGQSREDISVKLAGLIKESKSLEFLTKDQRQGKGF